MLILLAKLNKRLLLAIPAVMIGALPFGTAIEPTFLKGMIIPYTFLMLYCTSICYPGPVRSLVRETYRQGIRPACRYPG